MAQHFLHVNLNITHTTRMCKKACKLILLPSLLSPDQYLPSYPHSIPPARPATFQLPIHIIRGGYGLPLLSSISSC
ncbi:hypothetical protein BDQ12DRAFT_686389 [Crucibulum laeve]|uniref:Uncharacterized protein n=1 Tax=Crucibulum laeve TaxID=68775 RepID=A0A5C3LVF9_9AGAR|nr:hypothetical protein BDQ12DRAFT_686389 [Crucibulum laeve]